MIWISGARINRPDLFTLRYSLRSVSVHVVKVGLAYRFGDWFEERLKARASYPSAG
jgi:hypothetical protein